MKSETLKRAKKTYPLPLYHRSRGMWINLNWMILTVWRLPTLETDWQSYVSSWLDLINQRCNVSPTDFSRKNRGFMSKPTRPHFSREVTSSKRSKKL
jgi:hypothetical protein